MNDTNNSVENDQKPNDQELKDEKDSAQPKKKRGRKRKVKPENEKSDSEGENNQPKQKRRKRRKKKVHILRLARPSRSVVIGFFVRELNRFIF